MNVNILQAIRNRVVGSETFRSAKHFEKEMRYLSALDEPKDDIERSHCQYLTQKHKTTNAFVACLENIVGAYFLKRQLKDVLSKDAVSRPSREKPAALFTNGLGERIIPNPLKSEYEIVVPDKTPAYLTRQDAEFVREILSRYPKDKFFVYKICLKIGQYRGWIDTYAPDAVIATSEYSFTSSALTAFCEKNNVRHINVMHGEKLADMTSTFFRFDRCYVWDEHYKDLFVAARADCNQFIISAPQSVKMNFDDIAEETDYKFYLADETPRQLKRLNEIVKTLQKSGATVAIRPHPIYGNACISKIFGADIVEDCAKTDIRISIGKARTAVARFSTVLLQAYNGGKTVVVDDVTNPDEFALLKKRRYILLEKSDVKTLSEILE